MPYSLFLKDGYLPLGYFQDTLFQYFLRTRCWIEYDAFLHFDQREAFINALDSNEKLSKFWNVVQEQHPEKKDYFLSLTNKDELFDPLWIRIQYELYLQQTAFEELPEEDLRNLQDEFDDTWHAGYRAALKGEAVRLNCDVSAVRPTCPVLPWKLDNDEESMFAKLPNDIFGGILSKLGTLEIFRMTLVCRDWKSLILNNANQLKRAEHAISTHIITFTDWMNPTKTSHPKTFVRQYQLFNWCLLRWYCEISKNLETLILDHPVSYIYLVTLLRSCPKLKHLRVTHVDDIVAPTNEMTLANMGLTKQLEIFMYFYSYSDFFYGLGIHHRSIQREVLISSNNLRVFKGSLNMEVFSFIDGRKSRSSVFSKLIALELDSFTVAALEDMAQIDNWQLKCLKFGYYNNDSDMEGVYDEEKARNALHRLLPKLDRLEILITSLHIGITNDTIQLLTNLDLNMSFAVLYHAYFSIKDTDEEWNPEFDVDPIQPDVLATFQRMLLSKNPTSDLSEIHFILMEEKTLDSLEAENTGFTLMRLPRDDHEASPNVELYHPQMQRRLGIEF